MSIFTSKITIKRLSKHICIFMENKKGLKGILLEAQNKGLVNNNDYRLYIDLITNTTIQSWFFLGSVFVTIVILIATTYLTLLQVKLNGLDSYFLVVSFLVVTAIILVTITILWPLKKKINADKDYICDEFEAYFKFKEKNRINKTNENKLQDKNTKL